MAESAQLAEEIRDRILASPELILEDRDVMRALVAARDQAMGDNIVDLRGLAMERLEARLERLEDTHRFVLAAAYENLSGIQIVQRAVLRLLEPTEFAEFLLTLDTEIPEILRIDRIRLVLETPQAEKEEPELGPMGHVLRMAPPGFIEGYALGGRSAPMRAVTLRPLAEGAGAIYGADAQALGSEALMRLDIGRGRLPGMLALASADPQHFRSSHGTDLLAFFAGAFERMLHRWLA